MSKVAVLRTTPETIVDDYHLLMDMAGAGDVLNAEMDLLIKLNLSWTKYFPACSTQPWQLEGVVKDLFGRGYTRESIIPVENRTVVTNPRKGAVNNLWMPILDRYGLPFIPRSNGPSTSSAPSCSSSPRYFPMGSRSRKCTSERTCCTFPR